MAVTKADTETMNDLIAKGATVSDLERQFPQYGYWEIYWNTDDFSFLGKKRSITNRLKKLENESKLSERRKLVAEAQLSLNELYKQLKFNSEKLIEIERVLRAK